MDIKNCKSCGKMFNYIGGQPICPACAKKLEDRFYEVKTFVYDNPRVTIHELSEAMDIPVPQINKWIREERLGFSDDSPIGIDCESCGVSIKTGRYCPSCKAKLVNKLEGAYEKKTPTEQKTVKENAKMRFLDGKH